MDENSSSKNPTDVTGVTGVSDLTDLTELTARFEEHRSHLRAVSYRMLGSLSEADDAIQETWLRLERTDVSGVENLGGWLTTVISRICLNMLRSREQRREDPMERLETRIPDPLIRSERRIDPEQEVILADSVGLALMVVMESLSPAERLAFVLHDMFAVPFEEIAPLVEKTSAATRQLASRARRKVQGQAPAPDKDLARQREAVDAFFAAARTGSSRRCCRCSTRTWCCVRTAGPQVRSPWCSPVRGRWRARRSRTARWCRSSARR